ncbi:glycosyl hydrolase family 3 C-terminal domain protein [Mycobacterium xenopi 3993]|nr:glycosyl hydrolase family 3 C-terminal domain protein [Mycobacterium xenopi 3993]
MVPGAGRRQAIAEILVGAANPCGRLPLTFPLDLSQTPRPELPGLGAPWGTPITIHYSEGAEVGYRWYATQGHRPMFAFGHGLSYTRFERRDLTVSGGDTVTASFTVVNTGGRAGTDVPQLYMTAAPDGQRLRLLGFERVELAPASRAASPSKPIRGCSPATTAAPAAGASTRAATRSPWVPRRWSRSLGPLSVSPGARSDVDRPEALAPPQRPGYPTATSSSPHVQRYASPASGQWHSTSMRTRHPQPSWPQVNTVPFS